MTILHLHSFYLLVKPTSNFFFSKYLSTKPNKEAYFLPGNLVAINKLSERLKENFLMSDRDSCCARSRSFSFNHVDVTDQ